MARWWAGLLVPSAAHAPSFGGELYATGSFP
jgi:hypothetical protein